MFEPEIFFQNPEPLKVRRMKAIVNAACNLLVCLYMLAAAMAARAERPNIILIMADDLGYETIGANGGISYSTPNIDHLARGGMRFQHAYAQPLCTPSRVQLMTGQYNVRNYTGFGRLNRGQTTFAHLLKNAGYATAMAGKWQLGNEPDAPAHFGFDDALLWQHVRGRLAPDRHDTRYPNPRFERNGEIVDFNQGEYGPQVLTDFIKDFISKHRDEPFFVYYSMLLPHCPFVPTPDSPDWNPADSGSKEYKGCGDDRQRQRHFAEMVAYMDKLVGEIVRHVESEGLLDKTVILFTGDNGTDKPIVSTMADGRRIAGAKGTMTDAGTRVPLIAYGPGAGIQPGETSALVDFTDFLPTLLGVAGVNPPPDLQLDGRSFLPVLQGDEANARTWIYSWYNPRGGREGEQWARNQRYKLYADGRFFDVSNDHDEKNPLDNLNVDQNQIRNILQVALNLYRDKRS